MAKTDKNQGEHTFFLKSEKRQAKKSVVKTVLICYLKKISKNSTFLIISKLYLENRNSISNFRLSVQILNMQLLQYILLLEGNQFSDS